MGHRKVRTTVAISADLLAEVDAVVREGEVGGRSEFLEAAVRREIATRRRSAIDAEFAEMANDRAYQAEAVDLAEESVAAGWEALRAAETRS